MCNCITLINNALADKGEEVSTVDTITLEDFNKDDALSGTFTRIKIPTIKRDKNGDARPGKLFVCAQYCPLCGELYKRGAVGNIEAPTGARNGGAR
jgi:hypothetical protein